MLIQPFTMADYTEVYRLWDGLDGIGLSAADEPERIAAYLEKNPGLSFICRVDSAVVGGVLCGHDGRRGYIHHLAVRKDMQGRGIGRRLLDECITGLKKEGIDKAHVLVFKENTEGHRFWEKVDWYLRDDLVIFSTDIG